MLHNEIGLLCDGLTVYPKRIQEHNMKSIVYLKTADRASEVMDWCEINVGPKCKHNPFTTVKGEGWTIRLMIRCTDEPPYDITEYYYAAELDHNVDDRTQLLFRIGFSS